MDQLEDFLSVLVVNIGVVSLENFNSRLVINRNLHLKEYILEELNVRSLVMCNYTLMYSSLRAEPNFSVLGKSLGKSMVIVANEVKAMSTEEILAFETAGERTIGGHVLKVSDIKITREFRAPVGVNVLVVLDLRSDDTLYAVGVAREIVNQVQKLQKKAGLEPTDLVEVFFKSLDEDDNVSREILESREMYIKEAIGSLLISSAVMPTHAVVLAEEIFRGVSDLSFVITLARPALTFNWDALVALCAGNAKFASGLQAYLLAIDNLNSKFQLGKSKIKDDCIEGQPAVDVVLDEHVFLTAGDYFSSTGGAI